MSFLLALDLIPSGSFRFTNDEDEHIVCLRFIIENNVRYVAALAFIEGITESCQQMVATFFLFSVSQLGGFSIDQIKFICWAQMIRTSLQLCYNISDVETALQQPYYSQLWQVNCHFFTMFFCTFYLTTPIRNYFRRGAKD